MCQRIDCESERIVTINGKTADMFSMWYKEGWKNGYVPENLFFGANNYGDYMRVIFCADCGQIQSKFPISDNQLKVAMDKLDD